MDSSAAKAAIALPSDPNAVYFLFTGGVSEKGVLNPLACL